MKPRNLGTGAVYAHPHAAMVPWQTTLEPLTTSASDASDVPGVDTEKNGTSKRLTSSVRGD
jgi:hypothetical protein